MKKETAASSEDTEQHRIDVLLQRNQLRNGLGDYTCLKDNWRWEC